jgi:hypothetical protein
MTQCIKCEAELIPDHDPTADYQFDNVLWLGFYGGYGMFVDELIGFGGDKPDQIINGADYEAVLCHDCAHEFVELNSWVKKLFDPQSSHSHKESYKESHPDHYGWDYDYDKSKTETQEIE